jgi:hypothetical protein
MVEETDLFLEFIRMVLKVKPFDDILLLDSLNVEKVLLVVSQHFGGIVEIDSNHIVT